jgi:hypothetical protein
MKPSFRRGVALVACTIVGIALAAPSPAGASTVTQWNGIATTALITNAGQAPTVAVIHLAMVHGAVFDAVNAIDGGYTPYLVKPAATPFDSQDAAAATAAYLVLLNVVPGQQSTLQPLYEATLAAIPNGPAKTGGINAGTAAAQAMIAARTNDGRFGPFRFDPAGDEPGEWRPVLPAFVNDPAAWVKDVKPFLIESADQFATRGPWPLTSPQYAREFNEVKSIGALNSTTRTQYQTDAAIYWGTVSPPGTWSRIVRMLDTQEGLSTADGARLYAQLYLTAADAFIAVWTDKARWSFWRPITAIRLADTDLNPATEKDENWLPLLANPPYPEHPSGHLALSGSFVETLQEFFHTDQLGWTDTAAGKTLTYTKLSDALKEIIDVRIWSGIHFRRADEDAADIAKEIATWRKHHYFKKAH